MRLAGCLRLSQHAIRKKYSRHVGSVMMSDDRGSIITDQHDINYNVT